MQEQPQNEKPASKNTTLIVLVVVTEIDPVAEPKIYATTDAGVTPEMVEKLNGSSTDSRQSFPGEDVEIPGYDEDEDEFGTPWKVLKPKWDSKDRKKRDPILELEFADDERPSKVRICHATYGE